MLLGRHRLPATSSCASQVGQLEVEVSQGTGGWGVTRPPSSTVSRAHSSSRLLCVTHTIPHTTTNRKGLAPGEKETAAK